LGIALLLRFRFKREKFIYSIYNIVNVVNLGEVMGRYTRKLRRGIVGVEAAIVLIAFVIISAAFAFMVINMGLFATQRSKDTISQGLREASSPLQVDGSIFVRTTSDLNVNASIIPLRSMGVKYVPVGKDETVVSLSIVYREGSSKSFANIYYGVVDSDFDPTGKSFDELAQEAYKYVNGSFEFSYDSNKRELTVTYDEDKTETLTVSNNVTVTITRTDGESFTASFDGTIKSGTTVEFFLDTNNMTGTLYLYNSGEYNITLIPDNNTSAKKTIIVTFRLPAALLIVENSDGDEALDASEKGFLVILLGNDNKAEPRSIVTTEIRVERSAPLTVEFMVPESLTANAWMLVGG